jgi:hypothetical protein
LHYTPSLPPTPTSVVSRKTHGSAGDFDIDLPLAEIRGVECRTTGQTGTVGFDYKVVFTFVNNLLPTTGCGTAGTAGGTVVAGPAANQCTENLNGLPNSQYTTVTLNGVSDVAGNNGPVSAVMGLLVGDTTADGSVNSADIGQTKSQSGHTVTSSNFREDVTVDGSIDSADIGLVKSKSGTGLPQ